MWEVYCTLESKDLLNNDLFPLNGSCFFFFFFLS